MYFWCENIVQPEVSATVKNAGVVINSVLHGERWQVIEGEIQKKILYYLTFTSWSEWGSHVVPLLRTQFVLVALKRTTRSQSAYAKILRGAGGWTALLTEGAPSGPYGRNSHRPAPEMPFKVGSIKTSCIIYNKNSIQVPWTALISKNTTVKILCLKVWSRSFHFPFIEFGYNSLSLWSSVWFLLPNLHWQMSQLSFLGKLSL